MKAEKDLVFEQVINKIQIIRNDAATIRETAKAFRIIGLTTAGASLQKYADRMEKAADDCYRLSGKLLTMI